MKRQPIALSFFSGALGLDLGLEKAGFRIGLACEIDRACRATIQHNRPDLPLLGDVSTITPEVVRRASKLSESDDIDLIHGGPPCQSFSTAGKRQGFQDNHGNAFLDYLELALLLRPRYLMIENVRGLLSCPMQHRPHHLRGSGFPDLSCDELPGGALNFVLSRIEAAGYGCSFDLYNAANFGTPQIRERVVILCARDGSTPPYPTPTHAVDDKTGLPPWRTFRDAVCGLKTHTHLDFPEKRLRFYRLLKPGQNWRDLPEALQREALGNAYDSGGGKTGFLRRLAWDKPSPTLVTHPAMPATDLAHPAEPRPLSIEEYKRLQEFPDDWALEGSLVDQYRQVGNAVPVGLGLAMGRLVMALLEGRKTPTNGHFQYSRYKNTRDTDWRAFFRKSMRRQASRQPTLF